MLLAIAYSANIGGIGTLIGTPVNLILIDQLKTTFNRDDAGEEINFLTWMYFALPISMISLFLCWIWLLTVYVGVGQSPIMNDIFYTHKYRTRKFWITVNKCLS